MSVPDQYLVTVKNLEAFLQALTNAQAPQKFTLKFLEQLGFKSTNDRLFIAILKALHFIDSNGTPMELYFKFIDQTQSRYILADAIQQAYSDLFTINKKANELSVSEIKNKLKTITQGSKSDNVLGYMANTFVALCKYANFNKPEEIVISHQEDVSQLNNASEYVPQNPMFSGVTNKNITTEMHYNIQIHLPETRDITVYDAIFKSLKEHLL